MSPRTWRRSLPEIGRAAAEESIDEDHGSPARHPYVLPSTAGMGRRNWHRRCPDHRAGGPKGRLSWTVAVVTKPFTFEGKRRMQTAMKAMSDCAKAPITAIVIPNQTSSGSPMRRPPLPMRSSSPTAFYLWRRRITTSSSGSLINLDLPM